MPDFESGAFNRALPPLRIVFNLLGPRSSSLQRSVHQPEFAGFEPYALLVTSRLSLPARLVCTSSGLVGRKGLAAMMEGSGFPAASHFARAFPWGLTPHSSAWACERAEARTLQTETSPDFRFAPIGRYMF